MKNIFTLLLSLVVVFRLYAQPDGTVAKILDESELVKCPLAFPESFHILSNTKGEITVFGLWDLEEDTEYTYRAIKFDSEGKRVAQSIPLSNFYKTLMLKDNKIIFITLTYESNSFYGKAVRLNEDLTIDNSFNSASELRDIYFSTNGAGAIAVDKQNRIYVGGFKGTGEQTETGAQFIYRLLPDGSLDKEFQKALPVFPEVYPYTYSIAVQDDGKILVAGNSITRTNSVVRLNEDGSLDESFFVSLTEGNAFSMIMDSQNRILIGGTFNTCNGEPAYKIARLLSDGTNDPTFITGTGFGDYYYYKIRNMWLHENGKIGVSGTIYGYNNQSIREFAILNDDGSLSTDYHWNSVFDNLSSVYSMCKVNDGELALFGLFGNTFKVGQIGAVQLTGVVSEKVELTNNAWINNNILELYSQEPADYEIFSMTGQLYAKGNLKNIQESLSISGWPEALYIVYFRSVNGVSCKKIIKNL